MVFDQTIGQIKKDPLNQLSRLDYSIYYDTLDQFPTEVVLASPKAIINSITTSTKSILLKGMHGIGISLLISRICCYWSQEFGLRRFKLVLWINLAIIQNTPATLDQLLQEVLPAEFGPQHISRWIESSDGKDVLFILDGWSKKEKKVTSNVFSRLLSKLYLKKCTIVVTSAFSPSAMASRRDETVLDYIQFDMFGLNPIQINQQVIHYYTSDSAKAEEFLRYIASNSSIAQLISIPVCLYGLLHISSCVPESELPVTWTELFSAMTLLFLSSLFPECDIDSCFSQYLRNFPHHVPKAVRPFLCSLSRVAYVTLQRGENAFSRETFPILTSQELTGSVFLHPEHDPLSCKSKNGHLHFTLPLVQDFLAALHVHTLSKSEQKQLMKNRQDLVYLWQFFSGLTATRQYRKHFAVLQNTYCKHDYKKLANCSYEAKVSAEIEINLSHCTLSRRDIYHLLTFSQGALTMKFSHCILAFHLSKLHPLFLRSKSAAGGGQDFSIE